MRWVKNIGDFWPLTSHISEMVQGIIKVAVGQRYASTIGSKKCNLETLFSSNIKFAWIFAMFPWRGGFR